MIYLLCWENSTSRYSVDDKILTLLENTWARDVKIGAENLEWNYFINVQGMYSVTCSREKNDSEIFLSFQIIIPFL